MIPTAIGTLTLSKVVTADVLARFCALGNGQLAMPSWIRFPGKVGVRSMTLSML